MVFGVPVASRGDVAGRLETMSTAAAKAHVGNHTGIVRHILDVQKVQTNKAIIIEAEVAFSKDPERDNIYEWEKPMHQKTGFRCGPHKLSYAHYDDLRHEHTPKDISGWLGKPRDLMYGRMGGDIGSRLRQRSLWNARRGNDSMGSEGIAEPESATLESRE